MGLKKSFVVPSVILLLCFLFIIMYIITGKTSTSDIQTLSDLKENPVLLFTSSWGGYDTRARSLEIVLDNFRDSHEGISLVDQSMAGEDFLFTLKTDFATGNDPDVFGLWPGSDVDLLVEQGRVADLTGLLEENPEWRDLFHDNTWSYVTYDDKIYGLPFEIIYEGLFVNIDLFEAYDVKVPETYEELLTAVRVFRDQGIIPIAYNQTPEGSFFYQNLVMKIGGKEDVENPFDENGDLKACFVRGMDMMKDLYDMGAFPDDALYIDDKARNDLFINKEAAMIVQGSWFIGDQGVSPDDESVDIVPFPQVSGGKAGASDIIYGCGNGIFHISQKAWDDPETREYSIELLKQLTSVESAVVFQETGGFISNIIIPDQAYSPTYIGNRGNELLHNAKVFVGPTDSFIDRGIWEKTIVGNFHGLYSGDLTSEQIADLVAEEMEDKRP